MGVLYKDEYSPGWIHFYTFIITIYIFVTLKETINKIFS